MLTSAALLGSGIGLSLGAAYLAGGMAQAAADHSRVERIAQAAAGGYAEVLLEQEEAGFSPSILRLANGSANWGRGNGDSRQLAHLKQQLNAQQGSGASDLECLTQAVYYEARGETPKGQLAVAQVVMNRVKHPAFPKSVCAVVYQGSARRGHGCQFSFTCDGSMRARHEAQAWNRARRVAARVLAGAAIPDVGNATHYHTTQVSPSWGLQMRQVAQVGVHVFYKFSPRKRSLDLQQAVMTASNEPVTELRLMPTVAEAAATVNAVTAEAVAPAVQPATTPAVAAEVVTTATPAASTAS